MTEATGSMNVAAVQGIQTKHGRSIPPATFYRVNSQDVITTGATFEGVTSVEGAGKLEQAFGVRADSAAPKIGRIREANYRKGVKIAGVDIYKVGRAGGNEVSGLDR